MRLDVGVRLMAGRITILVDGVEQTLPADWPLGVMRGGVFLPILHALDLRTLLTSSSLSARRVAERKAPKPGAAP